MILLFQSRVEPAVQQNSTRSLLHNLQEVPVYAQPTKLLTTQECVTVLLNSELSDSSICGKVSFSVEINTVFVVDLNKLTSPNDITCDNMGVWKQGGSRKRWLSVDDEGFVSFLEKKEDEEDCCLVWKRYYSLRKP